MHRQRQQAGLLAVHQGSPSLLEVVGLLMVRQGISSQWRGVAGLLTVHQETSAQWQGVEAQ